MPLYRVRSWPADDPTGSATVRIVLDCKCPRDLFEPVTELTFTAKLDYNAPPDDWDDFATEWLQRGTWIECQVSDAPPISPYSLPSFPDWFTFYVPGPCVVDPVVGAVYEDPISGARFTVLSTAFLGGTGTMLCARSVTTVDPGLIVSLDKISGVGDVLVTCDDPITGQCWRPHTRAIFYGMIWEVSAPRQRGQELEVSVKCYDPLVCTRGNGLNLSRATKMLTYETTWDWDSPPPTWDASDPDFLVNIPDSGAPGFAEEFAPHGIIHLSTERTVDPDDKKGLDLYEYAPGDYAYSASAKQIYFTASQNTYKTEAAGGVDTHRLWRLKLYYYDPADTSNTVKQVLTDVLTAEPWSHQGGCGFDIADIDLAEIYGFDASGLQRDQWGYYYTTGTAKKIRRLLREKTDGPITQFLDDLRESGLLPQDYWIRYDPQERKIIGRYMLHDGGHVYTPAGTAANEQPATLEGIAGRVECWSKSGALEDYAKRATITVDIPVIVDGAWVGGVWVPGPSDGLPYSAISTRSIGTPALNDGVPDTIYELYIEISHEPMLIPQKTSDFCIVFELLDDAGLGCAKEIRRVQLTGGVPLNAKGESLAPDDGKSRLYLVLRSAKVTVSASETLIDASNPGIPIGANAIAAELDPLNPGNQNGLDLDLECENIYLARYIAIRWEQDNYIRTTAADLFHEVIRSSYYILSSVKILGDGRLHYREGQDKGQVPYAQISQQDGALIHIAGPVLTVSVAQAATFTAGDIVGFWDTSVGVPLGAPYNEVQSVNYGTGDITLTAPPPVGLAPGDVMGHYTRWRLDVDGVTWVDFCYPKLFRKLRNSSNWLDIVEDDTATDVSEAEALAVERLLTMIHVARDHSVTLPLDFMSRVGRTMRCYTGEADWLVTHEEFAMNPTDGNAPWVMQIANGTDYDEVPQ